MARGLIVTGRRPPRQVDCALMNALADCLEASDATHASALDLLGDDARAQADPAAQESPYAQLHGFVGMAAEQRCFGAFAFFCGLYGQTPEALFTPCQAIAQDMMQIHNLCWQVWAAMGGDHRCDPAAHAEAFAAPEPRRRAARLLNRIRQCDRDNDARLRALAASLAEAQG